MKRLFLILAIVASMAASLASQQVHNAKYPYEPAFASVPDSLKGEVINLTMRDSRIYPGTVRAIQIYVPKQYDGKTPACLLVCMDGIIYRATTALNNMIAAGEIPVMIGIFINSGTICDADGNVVRYNRSNEFDRTDGTFARFLEDEVLPLACKQKTSDGRSILISDKACDRAITGASSGAICAFTAAWNRPDMFSRVYSTVGTFVSMRGGHEFPALIRKTEPKRLRIFLQDGVNDAWNPLFGEWWEANQLMESALDFSGYELSFKWDRGGHSITHGTALFPDAMRWLWKGWPEEVGTGTSRNNMLTGLLENESEWKLLAENIPADAVLSPAAEGVTIVGGGEIRTADTISVSTGTKISKKNPAPEYDPLCAIYPGGISKAIITEGSNWIMNYILVDGQMCYGEQFYYIHGIPRQICFDTAGNLYAATETGVQVCDHNGRVRAIIPAPTFKGGFGSIQSLAFVGNHIYVITAGRLYVRRFAHIGCTDPYNTPIPKSQGQG